MKTKEEILDINGFDFKAFEYENEYSAKNLLMAMDEYATQQLEAEREKHEKEMVEFAEWAGKEGYKLEKKGWTNSTYDIMNGRIFPVYISTLDLLTKFRQSRSNQSSLPNGKKVIEALNELSDSFTDEERKTMLD